MRKLGRAFGRRGRCRSKLVPVGLATWLASLLLSPGPLGAQYIALEGGHYLPTETMRLYYGFPRWAGGHRLEVRGPAGSAVRGATVDPRYPSGESLAGSLEVPVEELVARFRNGTFVGVTARLFHYPQRSGDERVVTERYITVVNDVRETPGSLRLTGRRFLSGQPIALNVIPPAPPEGRPPLRHDLVLFRPARRLPGGAILPAASESLHDVDGERAFQLTAPTMPGDYELQLRDEDGFVIDRQPISIGLELPEISMSIAGEGPHPLGSTLRVAIAPMYIPRSFDALDFVVLVPDGRGGWKAPQQSLLRIDAPHAGDPGELVPRAQTLEIGLGEAGPHRVLAYWVSRDLRIEAAWLDFEVAAAGAGEAAGGWPQLTVPDGPLFAADQQVTVALGGSADHVEGGLELQLYELTAEEIEGPIRLREELPGPPDRRWPLDVPGIVVMPEDLSPGTYEVYLFARMSAGGEAPMMLAAERFSVVPEPGSAGIVVNGGRPVTAGSSFPVEVELPADIAPAEPVLTFQVVYLGGDLPGCHSVIESVRYFSQVEAGEAELTVSGGDAPLLMPGAYEARLYLSDLVLSADYWPDAILLGKRRFEVVYPPRAATLSLPKGTRYTEWGGSGDEIEVRVAVPEDLRGRFEASGLSLEVVRTGEYAQSGAVRPALPVETVNLFDTTEITLEALPPGVYDLRLTMREGICLLDTCRSPVLDRKRITVVHEVWRGPATLLPHRPGPDGLEVAAGLQDYPPVGLRGSCGDRNWLPPPEDVVALRLVRNVDGVFEPIEGPLRYGEGIYLEARLRSAADQPVYGIRYERGPEAIPETIAVRPTRDDPGLLRSELHYALWPLEDATE